MPRKPRNEPEIVWNGPADLRRQLVPLDSLSEDSGNANRHTDLSISEITASYARFGQMKPLVADRHGVVRAGNGQLQAARRLGWTHAACVASDLPDEELALFSLADNRIAKRSELDPDIVRATLREAAGAGLPVDDLGWQPSELAPLLSLDWTPPANDYTPAPASDDGGPVMGESVKLTREQRQTFDAAVSRMRELARGVETSEGQVVEWLSGDWLAGNGHAGEPIPGEK